MTWVFEHLGDPHRRGTLEDKRISDVRAAYRTNVTKRRDPNGKGVPAQPAFSEKNPLCMYFAGGPHTGPVSSEESLQVLDSHFAWRYSSDGALVKPSEGRWPNL